MRMEDNVVLNVHPTTRWTATLGVGILVSATLLTAAPAAASPLDTVHDFETGADGFFAYGPGVTSSVVEGEFCAVVPAHSGNVYDVAVAHNAVALAAGTRYSVSFTADSTSDIDVRAQVGVNSGAYPTVHAEQLSVTATETDYSFSFVSDVDAAATEAGGQFSFQVGNQGETFTLCIDDFTMAPEQDAANLIPNGDFATGELAPWFSGADLGAPSFAGGALSVVVPATSGQYSGVGFNGLAIEQGQAYTLTYTASSSVSRTIRTLIGENGGGYRTVLDAPTAVTPEPTVFTHTFTSPLAFPATTTGDSFEGQLAFQIGGRGAESTFTIDDVSLVESTAPPVEYEPETGPRVRVNQVGYLPDGPKQATVVTDADAPLAWQLQSGGVTVASGSTTPAGVDPTAGTAVHTIDFGAVTTPGSAYTLVVDGETSYEFAIAADLYQQLRYDALNYFYLARSGIDIEASVVGAEYAREAGHVGVAPNLGDTAVQCLTDEIETGPYSYGDWTCDYTLDVTGGWYDAGDHGKYVVNGGIATAQVLSTYERTLTSPTAQDAELGDGTLNIPADESSNGVPDALDEARWELDFMQSMQVPSGEYAGMVHHKIHDMGWTGLPLAPADDPRGRYLHRPSTAATLNFAATAAQGARLWAPYDAEYASQLLAAGRVAWEAALATPDLYAPADMGGNGGGPYDDDNVGDEFYWAAAEMYLTTGEQAFADYVLASEYNTADIWTPSGFSWGETAALGRLDLATVQSDIPGREAIRDSVVAGAEKYLSWQQAQPFGTAYPGRDGVYEWGSNSMVLNNQVVLGTAFDLTSDQRFADAVLESMDYLLGRNALNNSYITGYGDVFSENQHSRWFAASLDPALPRPPQGSVAGGPNSDVGTWDPVITGLYDADRICAPQLCYIDDIQSWSTNEITVNWNSALSWVASFAADQRAGDESGAGSVVRIETDPADTTVTEGSVATFTASATADPAATVQWQVRDDGAWTDIDGATAGTLSVTATLAQNGARYRAVFSNTFGSAATASAALTVVAAAGAGETPAATPGAGTVAGRQGATRLGATGWDGGPVPLILAALLLLAGASLKMRRMHRREQPGAPV
jgi:endoglucanase